jgi:hypothetical protein
MAKINPKYNKYIANVKYNPKFAIEHEINETFNYGPDIKSVGTYNHLNSQTYNDSKPYFKSTRIW